MIVVDVETTGLNPRRHSIVSIGAVDFSNPKNQFYQECRIFEGAEITPEALQINGFTEEQVKDMTKPPLEAVMRKFAEWLKNTPDKTIAGENPTFDGDFMLSSARRYGIELGIGKRVVDLHSLSYSYHLKKGLVLPMREGRSDLNLDKTLVLIGLPPEPKPHNALRGAKMEAEAFSRLIYGKILLGEFRGYPLPSHLVRE